MGDVTKIPVRYRYRIDRDLIREAYNQPDPSQEMVWAICPYLRMRGDIRCKHCPRWEDDPEFGKVQRMCFGLAEEVCRTIFAMQKREAK